MGMLQKIEEALHFIVDQAIRNMKEAKWPDESSYRELGKSHFGVLKIRGRIRKIDVENFDEYKQLRKIIFPASLEEIDDYTIDDQMNLEELDFSRVKKLKVIPQFMVCCKTKISKFVIPQGVTTVGDFFLSEANAETKIYVPESVKKMGCISGNNDNDLIVYLFAHNLDIEEMEQDIKTLYVLPQDFAAYAQQLKDCDSEAQLCEMPKEAMNVYPLIL